MKYVEAFGKYGAKLTNPQWSVSAFGEEGGCLVLSLWQNLLRRGPEKGTLEYRDTLSKWKGNFGGRSELQGHLSTAKTSSLPIKLVIAHPATLADAALVGMVADESEINKTFSVRKDLIGSLESYDGDELHIVFRRSS